MKEETQTSINPFKDPEKYQEDLINLMKENETVTGQLYKLYSDMFPDAKGFWAKLSEEEQTHSYWLETLSLHSDNATIYFDEKRFNMQPIKESIKYTKEAIEKAKSGISLLEALATADLIEQGLLEKKYFEVFEGDSAEFKKTLFELEQETRDHSARVKQMLEKELQK